MVDHFRVADHIGFLLVFGVTRCLKPQRQEIKRIAGVEVQEATAEIEATTGTVVQVFTTGIMVQVFQLAHCVPTDTWSGDGEQS